MDLIAHIDDELANEYYGAEIIFSNGQDNRFSTNQRKKIQIRIPRPADDANFVNIHFGFGFVAIKSNTKRKAGIVDWGLNFHKLDWNISPLRERKNN